MADREIRSAIRLGLGSLRIPHHWEGCGLDYASTGEVLAKLAGADFPFAFSLAVHSSIAGTIAEFGSLTHQRLYLEGVRTGTVLLSVCITEPSAGSDAAAMRTSAKRDGSGWRLNGSKAWITNAAASDLFLVYAQTDPSAGASGIAGFLVDRRRAGLAVTAPYDLIGCHSMGLAGIELSDCLVDESEILFPPGDGFKRAMAGVDVARTLVAAMCCGMLETSLDYALMATNDRSAFGSKTIDFQGLQWLLADVATDLHAAWMLFYAAASKLDRGERATLEAAHAKKFATRAAMNGVVQCMQSLGARALSVETPIARHLTAAKAAQYLDGTTEIQNVVISRWLKDKTARQ